MVWEYIIVGAVIAAAVVFVAWRYWRSLSGKGGCSCGTGQCNATTRMAEKLNRLTDEQEHEQQADAEDDSSRRSVSSPRGQ
ncbi:MAG: FeoB-associated Cys-rich membrane protein [Phycisphaerae bacterium]